MRGRLRLSTAIGAAAALVAGQPKTGKVDTTTQAMSMDDLQRQLADRAKARLGNAQDFQVIVTEAEYPVGTLMRQGSTIPVDYRACEPQQPPIRVGAPSLFPSFRLTSDAAASIGLDSGVIARIGDAGVKLSRDTGVTVSFQNTGLSVLSDHDLQTIALSKACNQALAGGLVLWMVRGYVLGQRQFALTATDAAAARLKVLKIGGFDVNPGSGTSSVEVSDPQDVGFLQIISEVKAPPQPPRDPLDPGDGAAMPGPSTRLVPVKLTHPTVAIRTGRIYIQQDRTDTSSHAQTVRDALGGVGSTVAEAVQRIDSQKMPDVAQVRYFNPDDLPLADAALARLRATFPSATLVRIPLPAPPGQLEVWLPRTGPKLLAVRVGNSRFKLPVAPPPPDARAP